MKQTAAFISILMGFLFFAAKPVQIKPYETHRLSLNEPSEICYAGQDKFIVLANKGFVYETNRAGKVIRKSKDTGLDIEGACIANDKLYVSDESLRLVMIYNLGDLSLMETKQLNYLGPRNLGFEAITFNPESETFLLATEKNPQVFAEYTKDFQPIRQFSLEGIREVSALTFHNGFLYVLSDEENSVFKINLQSKSVMQRWTLPLINPEGICFTPSGDMVIVSDDMGKLFCFKNPESL